MWLWFLVIFVLLVTWVGGYTASLFGVDVPLWLQLTITVAMVLLVAGIYLYRRWRAKAAARALEREILRQSEQQAIAAQPDKRAELEEVRRQIEQGIDRIKKSKLGKARGQGALYAMPWYVIIGPPGAGKTTALRHSGLDFAYLNPKGEGVKGVGGTRNCEWWFSSEAILLDTAGRWSVESSDREEWLSFLQLLRRFRQDQPLNGLILAISVEELIQSSAEQLNHIANELRARIDEVITELGIVLPIYLMLTKADLVAGFVEYFSDLRMSERHQIFGASLAGAGSDTLVTDIVPEEFSELLTSLQRRLITRLGQERHPETKQRIYQFVLEFQGLKEPLTDLVRVLFQSSSFREQPMFRGFYLTSGTQEGRPLDRVIAGMARAFGLKQAGAAAPKTEAKSYFVTDLFRRVIFPERALAARTEGEMRRQRILRIGFATAAAVLAVFILVPAILSFSQNRSLIQEVSQHAQEAQAITWAKDRSLTPPLEQLQPLFADTRRVRAWNAEGPPLRMQFGMYAGDTLYPGMLHAYLGALDDGFVQPAKQDMEKRLAELGRLQELPIAEYSENYEVLKTYLLLSLPERLREDLGQERSLALRRLSEFWRSEHPKTPETTMPKIEEHVAFYLDLLADGEIPPWNLNPELVQRGRDVLSSIPVLERNYEMLIKPASDANDAITYSDVFDGAVTAYVTSRNNESVDGAYTRGGWEIVKTQLKQLEETLVAEAWVLGANTKDKRDRVEERVTALRAKYFETYLQEWLDFLNDFEVHRPDNAQQALKELNALSELPYPYERLLTAVRDRAIIEELKPPKEGDGLKGKLGKTGQQVLAKAKGAAKVVEAIDAAQTTQPIEPRQLRHMRRVFMPLASFLGPAPTEEVPNPGESGLDNYQGLLSSLSGVLTDLESGDPLTDPKAVANEFEAAYRTASGFLAQQNGETRPILRPLLLNPISFAWGGVVSDAGGASEGLWEVEVWEKWQATLANKYPFAQTPEDAAITDFSAFFNPKTGILWTFYEAHLKNSLRRVGPLFQPATRFDEAVRFRQDFLSVCMKRGGEITEQAFESDAETPLMSFAINLHSVSQDVSEVTLEIDGVEHVYKNAPEEWIETTWPASEPESRGARVRVRGFENLDEEIVREGDFGFFRLLDAADVRPGSSGGEEDGEPTLVATWDLRSRDAFVKLDIKPGQATQNLSSNLFMQYDCPRTIRTR